MKCRVVQVLLIAALAGMFLPGLAQKNYYVVVGAFSTEGKAKELTTQLPSLNADTAYAMNQQGHVVQLYVMRTADENVALAKTDLLQRAIAGGESDDYESVLVANLPEGKAVTSKKPLDRPVRSELLSDASSPRSTSPSGAGVAAAPMKAKGRMFKFTISDPKGAAIPGKVHFVDYELERDVAVYGSDAYTDLLDPSKNENMALVCGVFGYKQSEKFIDFSDPAAETGVYQDENGAWVIPYHLERLEKGDVSVMYNVAFHRDAVVMLPQSRTDLDELLRMMQENPNYEITIHGHCNGKYNRTIMKPGDDYFDIRGAKGFYGSAKELSTLRAEAVNAFLTQNGINPKRIKIFSWGGRYPLVDPDSSIRSLNDRIEIEIRKD
jgi:outer membrane protein OmpA-like peptidoglycan-associated protein